MRKLTQRFYRALLRLFPAEFREDFGREMEACFESEVAAARNSRQRVRAVLRGASALVRAAPGEHLEVAVQDVRVWFRQALRAPGSTLSAVLALALGIGASTALFGILQAVLWNPLPYPEDDRLVGVFALWDGSELGSVSTPEYLDYRARTSSFKGLALYGSGDGNLETDDARSVERVSVVSATPSLLEVLGVLPLLGRWFDSLEGTPGVLSVAVISHDLWSRRFGRDWDVLGREIQIDGTRLRVIGVMPPGFYFPEKNSQVWVPLRIDPQQPGYRGAHNRHVVARLADNVSLRAAQSEMFSMAHSFQREFPDNYPAQSRFNIVLIPWLDSQVGDAGRTLWALMGAVLLLLLVACLNVTNLLMGRALSRRPEMALRAALGARPRRLGRQLLTESVVLSVLATALGLGIALGLIHLVPWLKPGPIPRLDEVSLSVGVMIFAGLLGLLTSFLSTVLPTLQTLRTESLCIHSRGRIGETGRKSRRILVLGEVALAVVLLFCCGLLLRSFESLTEVPIGFESQDILTAWINVQEGTHPGGEQIVSYYDSLLRSVKAIPGTDGAGLISTIPLSGVDEDFSFGIEGYQPPATGLDPNAESRIVTGDYFDCLQIPLLKGRSFRPEDRLDSPRVVIVSRALSERYWGGLQALGKRVKLWGLDNPGPFWTVIGIVDDIHHLDLKGEPAPILYIPLRQLPRRTMALVMKSSAGMSDLASRLRVVVDRVDPHQALFGTRPLEEYLRDRLAPVRFSFLLLLGFGLVSLLLTLIGIYGLLTFSVRSRSTEIGIRVAVGASRSDVLKEITREGMGWLGLGTLVGLGASLGLAGLLNHLLFGVSSSDPMTLVGVTAVIGLTGLIACLLPALQALRIDPVQALRNSP